MRYAAALAIGFMLVTAAMTGIASAQTSQPSTPAQPGAPSTPAPAQSGTPSGYPNVASNPFRSSELRSTPFQEVYLEPI